MSDLGRLDMDATQDMPTRAVRHRASLDRSGHPFTTIGVIGVGYVGLVTGACFAELGFDVYLRDIDPIKIANLRQGIVPFHEPGLEELIRRNTHRMHFDMELTDLINAVDVLFVAVDTPPDDQGNANLSRIFSVIRELSEYPGIRSQFFVMKSTVPVGAGALFRAALDDGGLCQLTYVSNPEFLREGHAIEDFMHPDRVVIGADIEAHARAIAELYRALDAPHVITSVPSAEMIKYASNAFLATKISFINEIANVCDLTGADVTVVADGMGLDRRIGRAFLNAGLGYGGSCFPKDVSALRQLAIATGYDFQLLKSVIDVNNGQRLTAITKLRRHLPSLVGARVTLLGLTFKPNTSDMREAASLVLADDLVAAGASVCGWDPVIASLGEDQPIEVVSSFEAALRGADACIVVTEWEQIRTANWEYARTCMRRPIVIDGRNLLDAQQMTSWGFIYEGIGRGGLPETTHASHPRTSEATALR